jgi:hypothetical protein
MAEVWGGKGGKPGRLGCKDLDWFAISIILKNVPSAAR